MLTAILMFPFAPWMLSLWYATSSGLIRCAYSLYCASDIWRFGALGCLIRFSSLISVVSFGASPVGVGAMYRGTGLPLGWML